ncbi:MAG: PAS domain S-box protein [Anaerolineales bacterium]
MPTPLRVLILEDRPDDAELMVLKLKDAGFEPDWTRVDTQEDYLANLDVFLDVILADYVVPQFDGLTALKLMQEQGFEIPFIVVTGSYEELAIACMRQGAADYVLKGQLDRLGESVERALGEKELREAKSRTEQAMREREALYRTLFDETRDAIIITNRYGRVIDLNPAAEELFEYGLDETHELLERDLYTDPKQADALLEEIKKVGSVQDFEVRLRSKSGREMDCLVTWTIRHGADGVFLGRRGIIRDTTKEKQLEKALQESEARFQTVANSAFDAIVLADHKGQIAFWNPAASRIFGYAPDEAQGKSLSLLFVDEGGTAEPRGAAQLLEAGNDQALSERLVGLRKNGERFPLSISLSSSEIASKRFFSAIIRDIGEAPLARQDVDIQERLESSWEGG